MSAESNAGARLYALIGEAVHHLHPRFVSRLEGILKSQEESPPLSDAQIGAPAPLRRAEPGGSHPAPKPPDAWRSDLMRVERKLQGLGTVLEIVQAAHIDVYEGVEQPLIGEELVDGLLAVGRDLVDSARDVLRRVL